MRATFLLLLLASPAFANPKYLAIGTDANGVVTSYRCTSDEIAPDGVQLIPWQDMPMQPFHTVRNVLAYRDGKLTRRSDEEMLAENEANSRSRAITDMIAHQQKMAAIETLLSKDPENKELLARQEEMQKTLSDAKATAGVK